jgi:hypothetical protein
MSGPTKPAPAGQRPGTPVFPGGCVTAQLSSAGAADPAFITEASTILDFTTRQALQQTLEQRSSGRLHLDPLPE